MSLTQEQIVHIANLAKLHLESSQIEHYQKDLNSIVGHIDILSSIPDSQLQGIQIHTSSFLIPRTDEEYREIIREELLPCSRLKIINKQIAVDSLGIRA